MSAVWLTAPQRTDQGVHTKPVDRKWRSTGMCAQGAGMTITPFDDPIAFHRRWGHPDVSHLHALATSDPLLFAADHVMSGDRRVGSVALCVALRQGPTGLICIPDAPPDPTDTDCLALLGTAIQGVSDPDADQGTHHAVRALGIVHHRLGRRGASDSDRRWALALKAMSLAFGIEPIGVMARLYDGSLVRVDVPDVLPGDYLPAA